MMQTLLQLEAIEKHFTRRTLLGKNKKIRAVDGVSLEVHKGETLGIVGESGCGKSTLASLMIRLEEPTGGKIRLDGLDISHLSEAQLRPVRSRIQIVFQDPYSSLNPRFTVQQIVAEPMKVLGKWSSKEIDSKVISLLELVGLSGDYLQRYPYEFSGGQRQRISIARALTTDPEIIILDEPTSALDVSVQAQVLNLLLKLQTDLGLTYIFISHNLAVVKYVSTRIAVMYSGKIVELGQANEVMLHPAHPYTQELIAAIPAIGKPLADEQLEYQEQKNSGAALTGCLYTSRCRLAQPACLQVVPNLLHYQAGHQVACLEMKRNA
jgi:oligopeptide/dipeptide ABC transporter ATP-binding protein